MKTIVFTGESLAAEYNQSMADNKVDFLVDEVNNEVKGEHSYLIAPPVITGNVASYTMAATGATTLAVAEYIMEDIVIVDANGLDITENAVVIIGTIEDPFVPETAGTYAVTVTGTDIDLDSTTVAATLTLTE